MYFTSLQSKMLNTFWSHIYSLREKSEQLIAILGIALPHTVWFREVLFKKHFCQEDDIFNKLKAEEPVMQFRSRPSSDISYRKQSVMVKGDILSTLSLKDISLRTNSDEQESR